MTQSLSIEEIQIILRAIEIILRMLQARQEYTDIEATEEFTISNDFNLLDVINSLGEVQEAIENFKSAQSQSTESNGA